MSQKTTEYEKFKFRADNRAQINQSHVQLLIRSIKTKNLLNLRPILVNQEYEIIDGQHRLLAAKSLGVPIYFDVEENLKSSDIISLNLSKSWLIGDFLNYYCRNNYDEYLKLKEFMIVNNLQLKVALNLCMGASKDAYLKYKTGEFEFKSKGLEEILDKIHETIGLIHKIKGNQPYTPAAKFWQALVRVFRHPDFVYEKWIYNLERQIEKMGPRATTDDFVSTILEIYNWKNTNRISFKE